MQMIVLWLNTHTPKNLQSALTAASTIDETFGLKVDTDKTEMLCWFPVDDSQTSATDFHIGNFALKIFRDFNYLETFTYIIRLQNGQLGEELNQSCSRRLLQAKRVLESHSLSLTTQIKAYDAICLSALLYGSEACTFFHAIETP